ncbi:MAG: FliG N-terminal domain, partial [Acidobacteriaceae bacterium]|nr:FliG N-terminal domain [Acidobacteriaceae bacterium]
MPEAAMVSATPPSVPVRPPIGGNQVVLTGRRRAAILLMALGDEVARQLLQRLPDESIETVA